jgi:CRP/FNR family transcriptional regulator, anaerobic regulatory protein
MLISNKIEKGAMPVSNLNRWVAKFPFAKKLTNEHFEKIARVTSFATLQAGQIAYQEEWECPNYIMCVDGRTRVYKTDPNGREVLIYKVEGGSTCMLTTQCLLSGSNFPAESIAEAQTELAIIPRIHFHAFMSSIPEFREFVLADYTRLLGSMFSLINSVAFGSVEQRLARRLLVDAGDARTVEKTHRELAADIGSVREIVSRHLGDWERSGWVKTSRGKLELIDKPALASLQSAG